MNRVMMRDAAAILDDALSLSPEERSNIAQHLLRSLEEEDTVQLRVAQGAPDKPAQPGAPGG